jgi:chromosome segregation ATPase
MTKQPANLDYTETTLGQGRDAYVALQRAYDRLEEEILYRHRQQLETCFADIARARALADSRADTIADLRTRHERHLEERSKARAKQEALKAGRASMARQQTKLREELNACKAQIKQQRDELSVHEQALRTLRKDFGTARAEIAALHKSTSWRITAPLRRLSERWGKARARTSLHKD